MSPSLLTTEAMGTSCESRLPKPARKVGHDELVKQTTIEAIGT